MYPVSFIGFLPGSQYLMKLSIIWQPFNFPLINLRLFEENLSTHWDCLWMQYFAATSEDIDLFGVAGKSAP